MSAQTSSITIEPIVSYPREAEPGKTYLMTVDLRFPVGKEEWPYDEEEHEIYCLLNSAPLFDNEELGEAVIVLHRFGGTYGPAMFLLTANPIEMSEPAGAITLTLANRQLLPLQVFKLDKIRVSTKATTTSETVIISRQQHVASGGIGIKSKEQTSETPARPETDLQETETVSSEQAPIKQARIFISNRFGDGLVEQLIQQVIRALSEQYKVFTSQDILTGEDWARRIQNEIRESDYLIVFLYAQSVRSEVIATEVRLAHELAQQQGGRPKILPVRVAYREPFPQELGRFLNHIQWALWDTPSDTPRLIEQLNRAISGEGLPANDQPDGNRRARVFFAYKRNVEPDESTARQIAEAVSNFHEVFIDHQMPIGVDWAEMINEAFGKAEVLIVLLTAESMQSLPVRRYLELAVKSSEVHGGPLKIIPVRLAYRDPLPEDLAELDRIHQIIWQTPEDTPRVIDEIQQILTNFTSPTDAPEPAEESVDASSTQKPVLGAGISIRNRLEMNHSVRQATWSPDGKIFAATTGTPRIRFWDVEGEPTLKPSLATIAEINGFALSPDSLSFAVWLSNNEVQIGHINLSGPASKISSEADITEVGWSPDQRWLAIARQDGVIRVHDTRIWRIGAELQERGTFPRSIAWSPQGAYYLIAGYENGLVIAWDTNSWNKRRNYSGHTAPVNSVAISPGRAFFASGSDDGTVRVWRIDETDDNYQFVLKEHGGPVTRVCFSSNGRLLASRSHDGTIRLWRHPDWMCVAVIDASTAVSGQPPLPSSVLAFHPKETLLAACVDSDTTISILELNQELLLNVSIPSQNTDPALSTNTQEEVQDQSIPNPYNAYVPIGPEFGQLFVGRRDEFRQIEEKLLSNVGVVIVGPRRTGKTSILLHLRERLPDYLLPVYLNSQRMKADTTGGFLRAVGEEIVKELRDELHVRSSAFRRLGADGEALPPEGGTTNTLVEALGSAEDFDREPFTSFNRLLDELERQLRPGHRLLLSFDEFEGLGQRAKDGKVEKEVFSYLGDMTQTRRTFVLLFAGQHTLEEMRGDYWKPFFQSMQTIRISYLTLPDAEQLIRNPIEQFPLSYEMEAVQRILEVTGAQPYLIQNLCYHLINRVNEHRSNRATRGDVEAVLEHTVETSTNYFQGLIESAEDWKEELALDLIAKAGDEATLSVVEKDLERETALEVTRNLVARNILSERTEAGESVFRFRIPLFRMWVQKTSSPS